MRVQAILITGPSGVGKTTIAHLLQDTQPDPWLFFEVDRAGPRLPPNWPGFTSHEEMLRANLAAARSYPDAGFRTIIELGIYDEDDLSAAREAMTGLAAPIISLTCDAESLERHLATRGNDGPLDWARKAYQQIRANPKLQAFEHKADLVISTDGRTPQDIASQIAELLTQRSDVSELTTPVGDASAESQQTC